jgi:hypothetical protein
MLTLSYKWIGMLNFVLHAFSNLEPAFLSSATILLVADNADFHTSLICCFWSRIPAWLETILHIYIGSGYFSLMFASVLQVSVRSFSCDKPFPSCDFRIDIDLMQELIDDLFRISMLISKFLRHFLMQYL